MSQIIFAATGHRPTKLGGYGIETRRALRKLAKDYLSKDRPDRVISGMALGWDQAWAEAALALDIPLTAAIPFKDQPSLWPKESQDRYFELLSAASSVHTIDEQGVMRINVAMQKRNEWMVDHSSKLVALWDGSFGGTHNCIVYARKVGREIDNLWSTFAQESDL